jgi:hypothetical protein
MLKIKCFILNNRNINVEFTTLLLFDIIRKLTYFLKCIQGIQQFVAQ